MALSGGWLKLVNCGHPDHWSSVVNALPASDARPEIFRTKPQPPQAKVLTGIRQISLLIDRLEPRSANQRAQKRRRSRVIIADCFSPLATPKPGWKVMVTSTRSVHNWGETSHPATLFQCWKSSATLHPTRAYRSFSAPILSSNWKPVLVLPSLPSRAIFSARATSPPRPARRASSGTCGRPSARGSSASIANSPIALRAPD
jgi:hypothetical protein